jgi:acetyl esterase/lipase
MQIRDIAQVLGALCTALWLGTAPAAEAPPPAAHFFKPAQYQEVQLSPSGMRLAATVPAADGRRALAVVEIDAPGKSRILARYNDMDVVAVQWVNDERLLYMVVDTKERLDVRRGGMLAIDVDGKEPPVKLAFRNLHSRLLDGSQDVLVTETFYRSNGEPSHVNLMRMDTVSSLRRSLSRGAPDHVMDWTVDWRGQPRLVRTRHQGVSALHWKASDDGAWTKISETPSGGLGEIQPLFVDSAQRVYATAHVAPKADLASLVTMDLSDPARPKIDALLSLDGFDFQGQPVLNRAGAVVGIRYLREAWETYWLDPAMQRVQQQVDAALPSTNNLLDCGDCQDAPNVLITSTSDRSPPVYRIYRTAKATIEPLAAARPWIQAQDMARTDLARVPARDGMRLPVWVTRPKGRQAPAAAVVLVHGGPWSRGSEWAWNEEVQFLASRGYVVIQPEFRGSTGFGHQLFHAGWKQWGLAMQDDVADAALWAVKQGHADPKRICIAGGSYGGYATLMGLVRNPEIFRCGVAWVAVTDIELMYSIYWSDLSNEFLSYGMPKLVGDREKDAAQLAATSPVRQAARLTQPLFLAYGRLDRRVPLKHGEELRDALARNQRQVEWKVYDDEAHGWSSPANSIDFWSRVETFLGRHLAP